MNLLYLFITISNIILFKSEKLIFVQTFFFVRGTRAPIKLNNDILDLLGAKWTNSGELTPIGKIMEFILGLYNRKNI